MIHVTNNDNNNDDNNYADNCNTSIIIMSHYISYQY